MIMRMKLRLGLIVPILVATQHIVMPAAHASSKNGQITLPVIVDPNDLSAPNSTTVNAGSLFGAQEARFKSHAHLKSAIQIQQKNIDLSFSPGDLFIEYAARVQKSTFPIYCTAIPSKPLWALVCLADRDNDGAFEQLWSGSVANPRLWVPHPNIRHQVDIDPVEYEATDGGAGDPLSIGFVGYGGNIWTGQREFYVQLARGEDRRSVRDQGHRISKEWTGRHRPL